MDCKFTLGHPEVILSLSFLPGFSSFPFVFPQRTLHTWLLNQGQGNVKHINLSMKQSLNVDKRNPKYMQTDKINITDSKEKTNPKSSLTGNFSFQG